MSSATGSSAGPDMSGQPPPSLRFGSRPNHAAIGESSLTPGCGHYWPRAGVIGTGAGPFTGRPVLP